MFDPETEQFYVWAIGKINALKEPGFHHIYPKGLYLLLQLSYCLIKSVRFIIIIIML